MEKSVTPKNLVSLEEVSVTLREIIQGNEPLQRMSLEKFPVMLSYKISRTLKALDGITESFSADRKLILDKYGKFDPKLKSYSYEGENEKIVNEKLNAMLDKTVTVKIARVAINELANTQIEPRTLALLDWFFVA